MKLTGKFTTGLSKTIGSVMTVAFSLLAFAYGQSCTLLPGFSPSTLANGVSRTAYQVPEATYTQSCADAMGTITCDNGTVINGNTYKYPSCIAHTWSGCTNPTAAHLEYKPRYKLGSGTYTQTCLQLSQSLQCLNGVYTGGIQPRLYTFGSCIDPNRAQCIDIRTNSYKDHGESIIGYSAATPGIGQSCTTLQKTLTCINGTWSGGIQSSLTTGCTNPASFASCTSPWTQIVVPHNTALDAYTSPSGVCTNLVRHLTCINGQWSGYVSSLSSGCVDTTTLPCALSDLGMGSGTKTHGSIVNRYSQSVAQQSNGDYCIDFLKPVQCANGVRSGNAVGYSNACQNIASGSCYDSHTSNRIPPYGTVFRYLNDEPTSTETCNDLRRTLTCVNGIRSGDTAATEYTCGNCILPRGGILPELATTYGYSSRVWETTGQNYTSGCAFYEGLITCRNSTLREACTPIAGSSTCATYTIYTGLGGTASTTGGLKPRTNNYKYSASQCTSTFSARSCTDWSGGIITHGQTKIGYSRTEAEWPKSCSRNYSEQLTCINGIINGNRQAYPYGSGECTDIGGLTSGVDIAINESPGLLGQENISGGVIAQGSSPQLNILFKNKGDTTFNGSISTPGFLSCEGSRDAQNINIYKSNPISSFVINSGTKMGISIRIKSIFTQSLGIKTVTCKIDPTMLGGALGDISTNNTWTGTFEIVEASRFDLALSRSIESIKKNLEAAEGAVGAQGLQNFLFNKIMNVLVPLVIIIGILSGILGFYKLMFSSDENAVKEGTRYLLFGVIGIIVIMSAKFIGQNVYEMLIAPEIQGFEIARGLYDRILFPFIKFAIYLALGAMFVILVSRVITFLFGTDADAVKKAGTLIGWNVISMLIIIGAKQIVEVIYGQREQVVNQNITNLGDIGSGVLANKNIPLLYDIINYALGIASLVILVIIIIQTVKLLMKPDDPAQVKSIKNSLLYMFIGVLVLGAGYLIVNFAIIN